MPMDTALRIRRMARRVLRRYAFIDGRLANGVLTFTRVTGIFRITLTVDTDGHPELALGIWDRTERRWCTRQWSVPVTHDTRTAVREAAGFVAVVEDLVSPAIYLEKETQDAH